MRAVRRRDHVAVLERAADADGARLLADRDVEEAGQLAGAEALLDLLLEAADEQHLPQDVVEVALRERRLCLHLRHGAEFMVRAMALVDQWNTIERGLDPRWSDAHVVLHARRRSTRIGRAAALLAPAGPGQSRRHAPLLRRAERARCRDPKPCDECCAASTGEGIDGALELVSQPPSAPCEPPVERRARSPQAWDAALAVLPADWSDLLCELALFSSDHLDVTALLMRPGQPAARERRQRRSASASRTRSATARRRDGAALPRARRRGRTSQATCASCGSCPTRIPSERRAPSGTSTARRSDRVADPVSWKVIERGWHVFDADGNEVGKVDEITGDVGCGHLRRPDRQQGDGPEPRALRAVGERRRDPRRRGASLAPHTKSVESAGEVHRARGRKSRSFPEESHVVSAPRVVDSPAADR